MIVDYKTLLKKNNFSANNLSIFSFSSCKNIPLKKLLSRNLLKKDNGVEVGSINYIKKSPNIFIKAKSLSVDNYLLTLDSETFEYIRPQVFVNMNLKKGDLIISKDSNIGEVGFIGEDMPNAMLSTAMYKLPITENKYYISSFIKSDYFREQLNILVPKGATIRHAGKKFLDCLVAFSEDDKVTKLIDLLSKYVFLIEEKMNEKESTIFLKIDNHLKENSKINEHEHFDYVKISDLTYENRFDVGMYSKEFRRIQELISHYKYGISTFDELEYSITRGQNLQVSSIGKSLYSSTNLYDYYSLVLSNSITNHMTFKVNNYLGSKQDLKTIKKGDIIFTCRGNLGKCFVLCSNIKAITNIDNVHISSDKHSLNENIMLSCYLHYLQKINHLNNIAIQGSGADSFTKYHFDKIRIPKFKNSIIDELSFLYNNSFEFEINDNESEMTKIFDCLGLYQLELLKGILINNINIAFKNITEGNDCFIDNIIAGINKDIAKIVKS